MNTTVIVFAALFFVMTIVAAWLVFQNSSLRKRNQEMEGRALALEARVAEKQPSTKLEPKSKSHSDAPAKSGRPKGSEGTHTQELLDLRRDLAKFRDEAKALRAEIKAREKELAETKAGVEGRLYALQEENKRLLEVAREQDSRLAVQVRPEDLPQVREAVAEAETRRREAQAEARRAAELERSLKPLQSELRILQEKLTEQQRELGRWREAAQLANGKTLDPALFVRWYRRAQAARDSYQMIKRVRDLSDHKIELYQDAVVRLSAFVLERLERPAPDMQTGDVKADRWLSAALLALAETAHPLAPREEEAPSIC